MDEDVKPNVDSMDIDGPSTSDPVVKRIPVFYSRPRSRLALLHFVDKSRKDGDPHPLVPQLMPGDNRGLVVNAKHKNRVIQVNVPMRESANVFSENRSRLFADKLQELPENHTLRTANTSHGISYMPFESTQIQDNASYCIATMKNGACFLSMIDEFHQMRPALSYLTNYYLTSRNAQRYTKNTQGPRPTEPKDESFKAVQVQYRNPADSPAQEPDILEIMQEREQEPWSRMTHYAADSQQAHDIQQELTSVGPNQLFSKNTPRSYIPKALQR